MAQTQTPLNNPFALLMDPEAVFLAIAKSERLERLHSRVFQPRRDAISRKHPPAVDPDTTSPRPSRLVEPGCEVGRTTVPRRAADPEAQKWLRWPRVLTTRRGRTIKDF